MKHVQRKLEEGNYDENEIENTDDKRWTMKKLKHFFIEF
jgi:hypothetical protein